MRASYVVTYDICDPKRLRRVHKVLLGFGDHIQLSVFRCELNASELIQLRSELTLVINKAEDQVLFVHLGPVEGRAQRAISALGKRYEDAERLAVVVG